MHTPHSTHFESSRADIPSLMEIVPRRQYSMQVPHPLQSPGTPTGLIRPMIPISFSCGAVQL